MFNHSDDFSFLNNDLLFSSLEDQFEDDELFFTPEDEATEEEQGENWTVMIVDDDDVIHNVTRLALGDFSFEGKGLNFISAYSGQEAKELIEKHPDTALVLLDVVMERDEAGLEVVVMEQGSYSPHPSKGQAMQTRHRQSSRRALPRGQPTTKKSPRSWVSKRFMFPIHPSRS